MIRSELRVGKYLIRHSRPFLAELPFSSSSPTSLFLLQLPSPPRAKSSSYSILRALDHFARCPCEVSLKDTANARWGEICGGQLCNCRNPGSRNSLRTQIRLNPAHWNYQRVKTRSTWAKLRMSYSLLCVPRNDPIRKALRCKSCRQGASI